MAFGLVRCLTGHSINRLWGPCHWDLGGRTAWGLFYEVFRRSLLPFSHLLPKTLDHIFFGVPSAHDQWVFLLASVFGKIAYLDEPLADYIQHETNTYGWGRESFSHWVLSEASPTMGSCTGICRKLPPPALSSSILQKKILRAFGLNVPPGVPPIIAPCLRSTVGDQPFMRRQNSVNG